MERRTLKTLIVHDTDLECDSDKITLEEMTIQNTNFSMFDLGGFDLVVYSGRKGKKILKSTLLGIGIIKE